MVTIRGHKFPIRKQWKKAIIIYVGIITLAAPLVFSFYFGFWVAWYVRNLRIIRVDPKKVGTLPKAKAEETSA